MNNTENENTPGPPVDQSALEIARSKTVEYTESLRDLFKAYSKPVPSVSKERKEQRDFKPFSYQKRIFVSMLRYSPLFLVSVFAFSFLWDFNGISATIFSTTYQFEEGEFYVIKTAFPVRTDFFKNKKPLWERAQSSHRNNATPGAFSGHNGLDKDTNILISRQNMQLGNDCVVNADVKINENKNGVEVRFTNTPPKEILDILNKSGFLFWTPENESPFWSAKKTPEAIQAIKKITDTFPNGKKKDDVEKKSDKSPDKNKDFNFIVGNNTTIDFKADGSKSVQGEYLIIEANDLVPSHNKDCSVNSDHEITGAQPRDRTAKELCNQSKVIADNLNPTSITTGNLAFNGAPVTWKLGQVIQGNGRSIALKIAYDEVEKSAKKYRKFLIKNANDFGFEQEAIEDFEEPVLVRMVDTSQNEALRLGNIVDTSQAKLNRLDEAKAFVRNLSTQKKQIIGRLINDSSGETIGQIIDDPEFRRELKKLVTSYVDELLADPTIRASLATAILDQIEEAIESKSIERLAFRTYTFLKGQEAQQIVEEFLQHLPETIENGLDNIDDLLDELPGQLEKRSTDIEDIVTKLLYKLINKLDVKELVEQNIRQLDEQRLENLITGSTNEQLHYIQYLGAILGTVGGFVIWSPGISILFLLLMAGIILSTDFLILQLQNN